MSTHMNFKILNGAEYSRRNPEVEDVVKVMQFCYLIEYREFLGYIITHRPPFCDTPVLQYSDLIVVGTVPAKLLVAILQIELHNSR